MPPISTTTMSKPLLLVLLLLPLSGIAAAPDPTPTDLLSRSDASSLLSFKSKADLDNKLYFVLNEHFDYCQWRGVKCAQGRVVRLLLPSFALRGVFPPDSLSRLDQLRVLSLRNNSLSGPLPDLSSLFNLKSLYLDGNHFSGAFPPSLLLLHRLTTLDLSRNNFSGPIPAGLARLARLSLLRLEFNQFNGTLPPLNQSFLLIFNVSGNNLSGAIPVTPSLLRFDATAFSLNPNLCGEIIKKACTSRAPFFNGDSSASAPYGQSAEAKGGHGGAIVVLSPKSSRNHHRNTGVLLGSTVGVAILVASVFLAVATVKRRGSPTEQPESKPPTVESVDISRANSRVEPQNEESEAQKPPRKSGSLVFCPGESGVYNLEQLMRASAELLGRGLMGTTYKAVLDNDLIVTVKRLDAGKTAATSGEVFEQHMEIVGGLRHQNLVPIRAFFQAKGERLVIFDYQPNGSLFKLIHGSRSARAKPLHWTSCLKIAEDVAQGLAYIHQASKLPHGNLKSSNVLLGADFEARLTDYCLAILADDVSLFVDDPDSAGYRAPETRKSNRKATPKSDIYAFGVLLLELLTGKHASQHPVVAPHDMRDWVRAMRAADDGGEHNQLEMLTEVATVCRLTSPEQRPTMWQVLKMIQEIKDSAVAEDSGSAAEY